MLGRSASGPGGLSINTGSANLFGTSTSQPPAGGGLFGTTTTAQTTTPQTQTGGLFGQPSAAATGTQQQQQTPAATGGLFGSATAQQPSQPAAGGLFGTTTTTASQPAQTGGLFGTASTTTQQQPAQTLGLFSTPAAQQQQQQQQPSTGGLFGTSTTGGMFGAKPATTTTTLGGGLFGQTTTQPPAAATGGLTLGQSTAAQQGQAVAGVRIDLSNLKSTTRFNDLQESLQKEIAQIDEAIQKCIKEKEAIDAFLPSHGEQLSTIPTDVSFVSRKSEGAHSALSSDIVAIDQLRELVKQDADHARLSFKAIDNLKLPSQYHQAGLWSKAGGGVGVGGTGAGAGGAGSAGGAAAADAQSNTDLIGFFSRTADEMEDMMRKFEKNLTEIEVHLHGVQGGMLEQMQRVAAARSKGSSGPGAAADERVAELAAVLRDFEESILRVAGVVGTVKEDVTELQLKDFLGRGS
ncbi:hypothetical protein VTJ83DRAFT_5167 [Remersonia thermophila]|uniref:Uncharacterized protein n=1 Tax=Remersonia thermophila TaxID=72144 RepID=A0ABR4DC23_9PEZI